MKYRAVLFDLDGTLADTLEDIAAAGNHAMLGLGRGAYRVAKYRDFVGRGVRWLIEQALGGSPDEQLVEQGIALFKQYYAERGTAHTCPYDGVPELLDALEQRGVTMGVLSNKPDAATRQVVETFFGSWPFVVVRGQLPGVPPKPDPTAALAIAKSFNIEPGCWLYVGDSSIDMGTAKSSGMRGVGVTWGFRDETELRESGADHIIHHPRELLGLLELG